MFSLFYNFPKNLKWGDKNFYIKYFIIKQRLKELILTRKDEISLSVININCVLRL